MAGSFTQAIEEQDKALSGMVRTMRDAVAVADQMMRSARRGAGIRGGSRPAMGSIGGRSSGQGGGGSARVAFSGLGF